MRVFLRDGNRHFHIYNCSDIYDTPMCMVLAYTIGSENNTSSYCYIQSSSGIQAKSNSYILLSLLYHLIKACRNTLR